MDEDIWIEIFENEMQDKGIDDLWDFSVDENFQEQKGWLRYSLCCFAWFCCSICGRKWASSKVHLIFYMKLKICFGQVKMHVFRQKCKVCNCAEYEEPTFMVENVEIAMKCLVTKICQKFYKLPIEDFPRDFVKDGRQDGVHDRDNCEACSKGICNYIRIQEKKAKQQRCTYPENIYTTYNTVSHLQQSGEDNNEDIGSYRILSYSKYVPQHTYSLWHSRQQVRPDRDNPRVPQHLESSCDSRQENRPYRSNPGVSAHEEDIRESQCCCIIL
ncbi:receptor-transporting protein 3-like [Pyxicephalus adspersus]|uniref:3CxxC-type domain-containing protein n=1 Tax=Pyxicephalus adspersus TaxID=30357 RepID=A0AAV3AI72_PYXAD|nr:TPA: hypothetical protein GDO54_010560 [Pyxicephalus adspersus]